LGGEGAKNADRPDAGATSHFDVFGSVADVNSILWFAAQALKGQFESCGMRLRERYVFAADASGELWSKLEFV
jgi:hypothetical protein